MRFKILLVTFTILAYACKSVNLKLIKQGLNDYRISKLNSEESIIEKFEDFDFIDSSKYGDNVNLVYKIIAMPIPIIQKVPVRVEKEVHQVVPVYVPQPYPVEKEVLVPQKEVIRELYPVVHRYPVEKQMDVPVPVLLEQPVEVKVLVPQPVAVEKNVTYPVPVYVPSPYPVVKEVSVPYKVRVRVPKPYPVEKIVPYPVKVYVDHPIPVKVERPIPVQNIKHIPVPVEKLAPYGVKTSVLRRPASYSVDRQQQAYGAKLPFAVPISVENNDQAISLEHTDKSSVNNAVEDDIITIESKEEQDPKFAQEAQASVVNHEVSQKDNKKSGGAINSEPEKSEKAGTERNIN